MKTNILAVALLCSFWVFSQNTYKNNDFEINRVSVVHHQDLGLTKWQVVVKGTAGQTTPTPSGKLDGAPVLAYVFPTNLDPTDVGFNSTSGILALALTSHPDFDDTPLWDENNDSNYSNDGVVWHPHWVVLVEDKRVPGGLAVKQFKKADKTVVLPPTNPGMPMYMDSPGYQVSTSQHSIHVLVPNYRINNRTNFKYDGVTSYLRVNTSNDRLPMLGVYEVFSVASGDLSLPFTVNQKP